MPSSEPPGRIGRGCAGYPTGLHRLGDHAPAWVDVHGSPALLHGPVLGLFCSVRAPGRIIVASYAVARALAATGVTVAGGFQSPVEREVLEYLLRGGGRLILCPARGLHRMRVARRWQGALEAGRLLLLSPFPAEVRRPTAATAERRNRVVAGLSNRLLFLHASPGGRLARLAQEASGWGMPLRCLEHPLNEDLRLLGAAPLAIPPPG